MLCQEDVLDLNLRNENTNWLSEHLRLIKENSAGLTMTRLPARRNTASPEARRRDTLPTVGRNACLQYGHRHTTHPSPIPGGVWGSTQGELYALQSRKGFRGPHGSDGVGNRSQDLPCCFAKKKRNDRIGR